MHKTAVKVDSLLSTLVPKMGNFIIINPGCTKYDFFVLQGALDSRGTAELFFKWNLKGDLFI